MHTDLSPHLHTNECNVLIKNLIDCHSEHPFRKFMGYCNTYDNLVKRCLKQERLRKREANYKSSLKRHAEIRARILAEEQAEQQKS